VELILKQSGTAIHFDRVYETDMAEGLKAMALEGHGIAFLPFIAVYLASVLAGVLSHVPAGLGVLESMLLLLMPQVPPEQLLAAVLTYRAIYEVIPLVIALALWGSYEMVARDGARSRLMRQAAPPAQPPTLP